jgi:hypothetical protein
LAWGGAARSQKTRKGWARNSERAHRSAVRFRYVNTSQRLRLIASTLECMNGLCLPFRCVPNFFVHTRGFLAVVFRHSSNSKNFAAIRVGQQSLQGSHLAPIAFLRRLRDTHLESANVLVDNLPINGIPFRRFAGEPSSRTPLLGPSPLRTAHASFLAHSSSPANASLRETRLRYGKTLAVNPAGALRMK